MNVNINMGVVADIITIGGATLALIQNFYLRKRINNLEIILGNSSTVKGKNAKAVIGDGNQVIQGNKNKDNLFFKGKES